MTDREIMAEIEAARTELESARAEIARTDAGIAELFRRRMELSSRIAACKRVLGLPVQDPAQEDAVLARAAAAVPEESLREYYLELVRELMRLSREYQNAASRG